MRVSNWLRRGSPFVWVSGGLLAFALLMITSLVGYIAVKGLGFYWPKPLVQLSTPGGPVLGEITGHEAATAEDPERIQIRTANRDILGQDFRWVPVSEIQDRSLPAGALIIERLENGTFFGTLTKVTQDGKVLVEGAEAPREAMRQLPEARALQHRIQSMEKDEVGSLNQKLEDLRLRKRKLEAKGEPTALLDAAEAELLNRFQHLQQELEAFRSQSNGLQVTLRTVDGQEKELSLASILRIVPANTISLPGKVGVYLARLWEFVWDDPRESNTEGGVFPAIFGTVMMVMLMSVMVVPLGVMAALYLREYAKDGLAVRLVRVAVNNLAGVPSIVFGVFGLGFFVYTLGGSLDALFFPEKLPTPTFGTGGILWASLTLALLTVPVVIVATEEAIASVPRNLREASLALGATKWQTIREVVLPGAMPGILTGLILAMARGAGEVAPLMLTGVVKLAPSLPLDAQAPFLHLDRKFMHLGFHIYDVGFQSPNSEAAKPMVFMTTLLLLGIVVALNLFALRLRRKLRARMGGSTF
ncbi:MAG TPA: phosphate ABC transporter permease PstA [Holophagaceae bacterium]|nr:phosphate ABC transporter permease PstA [Holophagaceae bacterium]